MKTLIVGVGVAAAAFAKTRPSQPQGTTKAVGSPHLWQKERIDPTHNMGQPPGLLIGNVLPANNLPRGNAPGTTFMKAQDFAFRSDSTLKDAVNEVVAGEVTKIERGPTGKLAVSFKSAPKEEFDSVILAVGPGENRPLTVTGSPAELDITAFHGHVVTGDDFMRTEWRRPESMLHSDQVAIYGGSATAAWIAEAALARGFKVSLWFVRPGTGKDAYDVQARFAPAFPAGGRNTAVQNDLAGVRKIYNLENIQLRSVKNGTYRFLSLALAGENGGKSWATPDILVYALGYEHTVSTGIGRILTTDLKQELRPFFDSNKMISKDQCLIGIGSQDGKLMIVGSGLSSAGNLIPLPSGSKEEIDRWKKRFASYKDIASTLPQAARPTEGIAMVLSGIEALNQFIPATGIGPQTAFKPAAKKNFPSGPNAAKAPELGSDHTNFAWDINFNTCNQTQLAAYLAQTSDLKPLAANVAVQAIMQLRTRADSVFGQMDARKVGIVCSVCERWIDAGQKKIGIIDWINARGLSADEGQKRAALDEDLAAILVKHEKFVQLVGR